KKKKGKNRESSILLLAVHLLLCKTRLSRRKLASKHLCNLFLGVGPILLGDEVLEPLVFHLELVDAGFKLADLLRHFLCSSLECLLSLLLLDTEASRSGSVAATLVLLGGYTRGILEAVVVGRAIFRRDGGSLALASGVNHAGIGRR